MTRIKKRRSGKKRTRDQKRSAAGRRGARAISKAVADKEKKPPADQAGERLGPNAAAAANKTTGKTRSAGARRIAAAKSVAGTATRKPILKKAVAAKATTKTVEKSPKGFAPWNKNKFGKKSKHLPEDQPAGPAQQPNGKRPPKNKKKYNIKPPTKNSPGKR